jgi:hypothetical protein
MHRFMDAAPFNLQQYLLGYMRGKGRDLGYLLF